ncbi:MAG: MYG1 family protein [Patescibacteria group bacterium]
MKKIRIITHSGNFHADELFAVATLEIHLNGAPYEVIRTRDPNVIKTGDYVVDVGAVYDPTTNRFDHHQKGGAGERNGIPYSSFGLVWKHYGEKICDSKEVANGVEFRMVYPVDLADNGVEVYTPAFDGVHPYLVHSVIQAMRPTWKEGEVHDARFIELIPLMRRFIEREIVMERDRLEGAKLVRELYLNAADKRLIVIDGQYPWQEELAKYPEPIYVVKPRHEANSWQVECVRNDVHSFKNRKPFPEAWRGLFGDALALATNVPDSIFCHNMGFIAVAKSKEGALQLAQMALDAYDEHSNQN